MNKFAKRLSGRFWEINGILDDVLEIADAYSKLPKVFRFLLPRRIRIRLDSMIDTLEGLLLAF